jgi:endonuclease YncB( thermonuclease family)
LRAALAAVAFITNANAAETSPKEISGRPTVTDGATLAIGETEIRLFGIDAPEMSSGHGHFARAALEDLLAGQEVHCFVRDRDQYKRLVAVCGTKRTPDLAAALLAAGEVITFRRFLKGSPEESAYINAERLARSRAIGLWARAAEPTGCSPGLTAACIGDGNCARALA